MFALDLAEPPLVAEQREQGAVVAPGQHLDRTPPAQPLGAVGIGAPGQAVIEVIEFGPGAELVLEPVQDHVELERADGGEQRSLVSAQVRGENLDDATIKVSARYSVASSSRRVSGEAGKGAS